MEVDPTLLYWLLCLLKWGLWLLELITDALFGYTYTGGWAADRQRAQEYAHSAQLVTVKWRAKCSLLLATLTDHFLFVHDRYVNPDWILKQKNVTLMGVTGKYALFAVSDPDVDVFDTEMFPFSFMSQFLMAKQLVILPTASFHHVADKVGDPTVPVALVNMTARCGSTLLAQMINRIPNTRSVSECWATCSLHTQFCKKQITEDEHRALIRSSYRLLCKIAPGEKVDRFFMKMNPQNSPQFPTIAELFPQFRLFFNTRQPVPTMRSLKQILQTTTYTLYTILSIRWRNFVAKKFCFPYSNKYDKITDRYNKWFQGISDEEVAVAIYAAVLAAYFDHSDIYHLVILYEDLSENPEVVLKKVFKLMDIPTEHISASLKALEKDSQGGMFGERKKARSFIVSDEQLRLIDEYMTDCSIPVRHDMSVDKFKRLFRV